MSGQRQVLEELRHQVLARARTFPVMGNAPREAMRMDGQMSTEQAPASPVVQQLAARLGVNLNEVTGTGAGGRVRREDVERAARQRLAASIAARSAATPRASAGAPRASTPPRGSSNPYAQASGWLPPFTASGVDPAVLAAFPVVARPAMAAATSAAEVQRLGESCRGLSELDAAHVLVRDLAVPDAALNAAHELIAAKAATDPRANGQSRFG